MIERYTRPEMGALFSRLVGAHLGGDQVLAG
jgi:hypothetical protein